MILRPILAIVLNITTIITSLLPKVQLALPVNITALVASHHLHAQPAMLLISECSIREKHSVSVWLVITMME